MTILLAPTRVSKFGKNKIIFFCTILYLLVYRLVCNRIFKIETMFIIYVQFVQTDIICVQFVQTDIIYVQFVPMDIIFIFTKFTHSSLKLLGSSKIVVYKTTSLKFGALNQKMQVDLKMVSILKIQSQRSL